MDPQAIPSLTPSPERARTLMIEQQIRPSNVLDPRVLRLLAELKREDFAPPAYRSLAFTDAELPVGEAAGEIMLTPKVQARMVQDLKLQGFERVLQIGAGTGYMTALLARLCTHVLALEINPQIARMAAQNLRRAVVVNADVQLADGSSSDQITEQYDAIVLCGSVPQLPQMLVDRLQPNARLAAIVGHAPIMRFTCVSRTTQGLHITQEWDTVVPPLRGFGPAVQFRF